MKKYSNYFLCATCAVSLAFSAGMFIDARAAKSPDMPSPAAPVAAPGQPVDLTYAADKALPAVVFIHYVQNAKTKTVEVDANPFGDFFDPFGFFGNPGNGQKRQQRVQTPKKEATGSGVIISSDGFIVTNNHVVEDADELTVTLNDNREYSAVIIGTDKSTDLALIKIDAKDLPALPVGDSDKLKIGEWVLAVGNPFGFNSTVTAGIVSAKARSMGTNGVESFIQTDAAINRGNSGGALVNAQGELVGINAMIYSETGSYAGLGFAIPTTIMNKVVDDLKTYGSVQRAMLGIAGSDVLKYIDSQKAEGKEVDLGVNEGVYIAEVSDEGAGQDAGLKKGDVITYIDGKKVTKMAELQEQMAKKRPGDKITIKYIRDKKEKSATVTLKNAQGGTAVIKAADLDVLGANFREITDAQKKNLSISNGLEVIKVGKGVIQDAGITRGFIIQRVNDTNVKTIDELQKIVKEVSTSKEPVLIIKGVYPTGKKGYFAVPLEEGK